VGCDESERQEDTANLQILFPSQEIMSSEEKYFRICEAIHESERQLHPTTRDIRMRTNILQCAPFLQVVVRKFEGRIFRRR
jgi:hypothetical protein